MNIYALVGLFSATSLGGVLLTGSKVDELRVESTPTTKSETVTISTEAVTSEPEVVNATAEAPAVAVVEGAAASAEDPGVSGGAAADSPADRPYDPSRPSGVYANPKEYIPAGVQVVSSE